ncbi:hypothetical protein [Stutzerimonas kunmingensis]|uniref:hypothetical protein n=1 Tax=Stutzerimonas kunmingensis TaxID=1211807 RepID=UPI00241FE580|nr:hypothetical protein [Stutzerimonas kunmingensis]
MDGAEDDVLAAQTALNGTVRNLRDARAADSDAELANDAAAARTAVVNNTAAYAVLKPLEDAETALAADTARNGGDFAVAQALNSAVAAYLQAGGTDAGGELGDIAAAFTIYSNTPADERDAADAQTFFDSIVATVVDANGDFVLAPTGLTNAQQALLVEVGEAAEVAAARDDLYDKLDAAQATFDGSVDPLIVAYESALAAVTVREGQIADVAEDQADLAEAQASLATLTELVASYNEAAADRADALEALEDAGIDSLVELGAGTAPGTTGEADLFLFTADTENTILSNFESDDLLFIGEGFNRVDIASDVNFGTTRVGEASVLEVFFQQVGNNTVVTVEAQAFGGSEMGNTDITQITLSGVNAESLTFTDGYIAVA